MNTGSQHIIDKVFLEVNASSEDSANYIRNSVDSFLKDTLLSKLEILLDEYDVNNKTVRFDELYFDFFISKWNNEREIVQEFENSLRSKLEKELHISEDSIINTEKNREISYKENREDVFLFFLKNGFLPWYGKESYISELIKTDNWVQVIRKEIFRKKLASLLNQNENALSRFSLQFPESRVIDYLIVLQPKKKGMEKELRSLLDSFTGKIRIQLLQIIIQLSVQKENEKIIRNLHSLVASIFKADIKPSHPKSEKTFRQLKDLVSVYFPARKEIETIVQTILKEHEQNKLSDYLEKIPEFKDAKQQVKKATDDSFFEEKKNEIIVQNAGLVLLHPFLKTFFTETGIISKREHFSIENRMLATQALNYLAVGNEEFFEANMIFEKFLAGIPLKMPVPRESSLSDEIKSEANQMLKQVIKNWPALKNTSPDGLREMFLQREGKLVHAENGYKLIVERKTQDILLEKLNWNISVLKVPFREEILFIEW